MTSPALPNDAKAAKLAEPAKDAEPPSGPPPAGETATPDPHRSKVAPDDPRLRIRRASGRTLKKGPALALGLMLLGATLIALVVAFQPSSKSAATKKDEASDPATPAGTAPVVPDAIRFASDKPPVSGSPLHPFGVTADAGAPHAWGQRTSGAAENDPYSPERLRLRANEQYWKARGSGVLVDVSANGLGGGSSSPGRGAETKDPPAPNGTQPGPSPGADDPNLQERKNAFLDGVGASKTKNYLETRVQKPRSPYEVKAGTVIPAVLITSINSDLPGPVIGQVRENVYDTVTGNYLLIPQGSRLLATYDSMVAWGQERVLVCWNRLIFPNGDSINLECMPAGDLQGSAGLTDDVDEHWGRLLKGAAVASLLAATAQGVAGNTEGFNPTVPQMWGRNGAGEINQIGQRLTARNLNIQPTITVRPGYSVNVMVTKDLIVSPYPSGVPILR
jgi:type IV secretion system protein VirB10